MVCWRNDEITCKPQRRPPEAKGAVLDERTLQPRIPNEIYRKNPSEKLDGGGFRWRYVDEILGANEEAEEDEKVENEAKGEDEAEDEGEGELEDEGEDEAEDEDEEQLRQLGPPATAAALRKRIRSLPKLWMRNSS